MLTVLRREEKYPLDLQYAWRHYAKFAAVLHTDEYSAGGSYMVRSLYFDTVDDKDFFDKMTEQNIRRKIRLRIYNPKDSFAKLEMKQKENEFQKKRSLSVSKEDAQALIHGEYEVLLNYDSEFALEVYMIMKTEGYRPKCIVEYKRRAFMVPTNDIRLTFDSDIRATESSFELFAENLPLYPVFPPDKVILEVKYNRFMLSYISDLISVVEARKITSSKYCLSRSIGYPMYV